MDHSIWGWQYVVVKCSSYRCTNNQNDANRQKVGINQTVQLLTTQNTLNGPTALQNTDFNPCLLHNLQPISKKFIPPPHQTNLDVPTSLSYQGILKQLGYIGLSYLIDLWHMYLNNHHKHILGMFKQLASLKLKTMSLTNGDNDPSSRVDTSSSCASPQT